MKIRCEAATHFLVRLVEAAGVLVIFVGAMIGLGRFGSARGATRPGPRASRQCGSRGRSLLSRSVSSSSSLQDLLRTAVLTDLPGDREARAPWRRSWTALNFFLSREIREGASRSESSEPTRSSERVVARDRVVRVREADKTCRSSNRLRACRVRRADALAGASDAADAAVDRRSGVWSGGCAALRVSELWVCGAGTKRARVPGRNDLPECGVGPLKAAGRAGEWVQVPRRSAGGDFSHAAEAGPCRSELSRVAGAVSAIVGGRA